MSRSNMPRFFLLFLLLCFGFQLYAYDLFQVKREKLANGLTVMVLEDPTQPLVSTQVLYRAGGRNECAGATGLAHFVEHMAFRATKEFPDTQDAIYSVGGEWHGYTWIDQTTYFETVPREHLDVVLRLQADRMRNVVNRREEVEAERGAVLTELHSYENDPASVLYDNVVAASFQQHPYRYNVIGWTSDVEQITHLDLVNFYDRFYQPGNAILAVAGDIVATEVFAKAKEYFGAIDSNNVDSEPRTVEPVQHGERRVRLMGSGGMHYFQITYRAPAAEDPDFPAFLLLQGVLGGSGGVNFRQSGFAEEVRPDARLFGAAAGITTFFTATADPYIFNIAGRVPVSVKPQEVETAIEQRVSEIRVKELTAGELDSARKSLQAELIFDIETTEDAAHQMAYFEGIGAFEVLQNLPSLLNEVTVQDLQRIAQKYLAPEKRTIGWYEGDGSPMAQMLSLRGGLAARKDARVGAGSLALKAPAVTRLKNGIILITQTISRAPTGFLRVLLPTNTVEVSGASTVDDPVWRYTSVHRRFLKEDFAKSVAELASLISKGFPQKMADPVSLEDPEYRVVATLKELLGAKENHGVASPVVVVMVGDIQEDQAVHVIGEAFKSLKAGRPSLFGLGRNEEKAVVRIPGKAQSQVGYAIPAPPPTSGESYAYRILLYIMTHGYGGRVGDQLISRRGLIYYIASSYHSDGKNSWISISFGVNPDRLQETKTEFKKWMQALRTNPPTQQEMDEAKQHLIGRRITAFQSNEEISAFYAREWIEQGRLMEQSEFERRVHAVTLHQVHRIIPDFLNGVTAVIDTN